MTGVMTLAAGRGSRGQVPLAWALALALAQVPPHPARPTRPALPEDGRGASGASDASDALGDPDALGDRGASDDQDVLARPW
jgi:hypothetical protein